MRFFERGPNDKATSIERVYFDADRGCIALALERMEDIRREFPRDAVLEYAEGILRKDFLGQGLRVLEQFRLAQEYDPKHIFSAFNAAKYASEEREYRARSAHARRIAPEDPDLRLFDQIDQALGAGQSYQDLLSGFVAAAQRKGRHGDCAAVSELALCAGHWSRSDELALRRARCAALRELDLSEESSRRIRREDYPPCERLALADALAELEHVLSLDPSDPKMLNYKSAWLALMRRYEESIAAADAALKIQPTGYLKPLTNKSFSLSCMGRHDEARVIARQVIETAKLLGSEFDDDVAKARGVLESLKEPGPSDEQKLSIVAQDRVRTAMLTAEEAQKRWEAHKRGFNLAQGIQQRCFRYGGRWHPDYIVQTAELLHDFCPEWAWQAMMELGKTNHDIYSHYLHAAMFVAAQAEGVTMWDACAFNVLVILSALEPGPIRNLYREVVLAPAAVDDRFAQLPGRMRQALERLNPELPRLVADQPPIDKADRQHARITLARFNGAMDDGSLGAGRLGCATTLLAAPFFAIKRWLE